MGHRVLEESCVVVLTSRGESSGCALFYAVFRDVAQHVLLDITAVAK
jgi:hypothetical protein